MVYCTKCGTKNPDEVRVCSQCGASLYAVGDRQYYRRVESECFGIPGGSAVVGIAIGAIILLWGFILAMRQINPDFPITDIWPFAAIIFGALIIVGAIYGMRRRR